MECISLCRSPCCQGCSLLLLVGAELSSSAGSSLNAQPVAAAALVSFVLILEGSRAVVIIPSAEEAAEVQRRE